MAELLDASGYPADDVLLCHADTRQSRQTVEVLRGALHTPNARPHRRAEQVKELPRFNPARLPTYGADLSAIDSAWTNVQSDLRHPCVIVGHDPQMTWLLHEIAPEATRYSLATCELMILEPAPQPPDDPNAPKQYRKPRFVLSPSGAIAADALCAKIESKMRTAGILGAFLTGEPCIGYASLADR